jgi:dTDP-4-amino-4,6-dideoxygalactose transaminase
MSIISDYENPFNAINDFEYALSNYTGAPYVVTTDCCTHAIELCFRYKQAEHKFAKHIAIPNRTYLSVPMVFHKLNIQYTLIDLKWKEEYNFGFTEVWDSARSLRPNMYKPGQMQCLSFGRGKPLEIGQGGAILLDNVHAYKWLKLSSYDGRDLSIHPWIQQQTFNVGYHYMMRPEACISGINLIKNNKITHTYNHSYPNISNIIINE